MTLGQKLKLLRKEKDWSQIELSEKLGCDSKQIGRYENDKTLPSADIIIKIAQTFNISIDYLLLENIPRRPLDMGKDALLVKFQEIGDISEEDKQVLIHIMDALAAKNEFKKLANKLK